MSMPIPDPQRGERLAGEGRQAYRAFTLYRNMPVTERGLRSVANKLGKSKSLIGRWSSKYEWVARARECDQQQEKVEINEQEEARRQVSRRQAATAERLEYVGMHLSGILKKRLPELEAYLEKVPLQRLARRCITMVPLVMRLQREEREAYLLLEALEPPQAVSEEPPERPDKDTKVIILNGCLCGKSHHRLAEQWPCESAKAYAAFKTYRELGEERSVRATGRKRKSHRSQLQRWAQRYEWRRRAEQYDNHQRRLKDGTDVATQVKHIRRRIGEIDSIMDKLKLITRITDKRLREPNSLSMDALLKLTMLLASKAGVFMKGEQEAHAFTLFEIDRSEPGVTRFVYAPRTPKDASGRRRKSPRFSGGRAR